jgi:hypothetical protein
MFAWTGSSSASSIKIAKVAVGSEAKFQGQELLCLSSHSLANIVARDNQILVIAGPATDNDMDVGMLCIPVIDGDPVEAGAQIAFGFGHEVAREGFDIGKFSGILGRNDEAEMMPVLLAPLCKSPMIDALLHGCAELPLA